MLPSRPTAPVRTPPSLARPRHGPVPPLPSTTPPRTHPCRPRHGMDTAVPPHCPSRSAYIRPPLAAAPLHTTPLHPTPSPRSHPERSSELHFEQLGHRAAPPLQLAAGDATAALLLPRPPQPTLALASAPRRRQEVSPAAPRAPSLSLSSVPSGGTRRPCAVGFQINGSGSLPPVLNFC